MTRRAVFLDRDGVLIDTPWRDTKPGSPRTLAEVQLLPGVPEAVAALNAAGWAPVMVTNQPDIANGRSKRRDVEAINAWLKGRLGLTAVCMCPHRDEDRCECRKPKPGLLRQAAERFDLDLARSVMVGDRWRDVGAGRAAGCRTVYIDRHYAERGLQEPLPDAPDHVAASLPDALRFLLA